MSRLKVGLDSVMVFSEFWSI